MDNLTTLLNISTRQSHSLLIQRHLGLILLFVSAIFTSQILLAQESTDYHAEHILEVPMDFVYQTLPQKPINDTQQEWRFGYAYADTSSGGIAATVPMVNLHYYGQLADKGFFSLSAFYQKYHFSGNPQRVLIAPTFANLSGYPQSFNANMTQVSGDAVHFGVSFGYYFDFDSGASLQLGAIVEKLQVNQFKLDFISVGFPIDFLGNINYAGSYNAITPYASYQFSADHYSDWTGNLRVVFAKPLPRVGLKGTFSTSNYQVSGDSKSAADVTPIPDSYLGMGYTLEYKNGFRIDLGATLYAYIFEPYGHSGFDSPIFLSFSNSF